MHPVQFGSILPIPMWRTRHLSTGKQLALGQELAIARSQELAERYPQQDGFLVGLVGVSKRFRTVLDRLCQGRNMLDPAKIKQEAIPLLEAIPPDADTAEFQYYITADDDEGPDREVLDDIQQSGDPMNAIDVYLYILSRQQETELARRHRQALPGVPLGRRHFSVDAGAGDDDEPTAPVKPARTLQ